jgi:iron complex outermembrane recepter protein
MSSYGSYNTLNTQFYHQDARENMNFFGGVNFENSDYTNYGTDNSWLNMQKDPEYKKLKGVFRDELFLWRGRERNSLSLFLNHTSHNGDAGRIYRGFRHNYTTLNISQSSELSESLDFQCIYGIAHLRP